MVTLALILFQTAVGHFLILIQNQLTWVRSDIRGLLADVGVCLILAYLFVKMSRFFKSEKLKATLIFLYGVLVFANVECIRATGSSIDFHHAKYRSSGTFFGGAVLLGRVFLNLIFFAFLPAIVAVFFEDRSAIQINWKSFLVGFFCLFLVNRPFNYRIARWRQNNVLQDNLATFVRDEVFEKKIYGKQDDPSSAESQTDNSEGGWHREIMENVFKLDLDGEKRFSFLGSDKLGLKKNVLLITVESMSGAYIKALSKQYNSDQIIQLERLNNLAEQNIVVPGFIAHQRQTDCGEYSLLCGDMPFLARSDSKMGLLASKNYFKSEDCLPDVLAKSGYRTVYLQSAPQDFMEKATFMPLVGFIRSFGFEWFTDNERT